MWSWVKYQCGELRVSTWARKYPMTIAGFSDIVGVSADIGARLSLHAA
jgi:hypothetical protein